MHFANGEIAYILKLSCQFLKQSNFYEITNFFKRIPISITWPTYFCNIINFFPCLEKAWEGTSSRARETALVLQASILFKVSCWSTDVIIHRIIQINTVILIVWHLLHQVQAQLWQVRPLLLQPAQNLLLPQGLSISLDPCTSKILTLQPSFGLSPFKDFDFWQPAQPEGGRGRGQPHRCGWARGWRGRLLRLLRPWSWVLLWSWSWVHLWKWPRLLLWASFGICSWRLWSWTWIWSGLRLLIRQLCLLQIRERTTDKIKLEWYPAHLLSDVLSSVCKIVAMCFHCFLICYFCDLFSLFSFLLFFCDVPS